LEGLTVLRNKETEKTKPINKVKLADNSKTTVEPYDQLYTYDDWHKGCKIRSVAHIWQNEHLVKMNKWLGLVTVIFTVAAGSSIFTGISLENGLPTENHTLYYIAFAISLIVSLLVATQTFLTLPRRAQVHHQTFVEYCDLCCDIENHVMEYIELHRDMETLIENMNKINDRMKTVESGRPNIPEKQYKKAKEHVKKLIVDDELKNFSELLRQRERLEAKGLKDTPKKNDS